jgi:GT2 family glycosyltransferase
MSAPTTVVLVHWNQASACLETIERFRDQDVAVAFVVVDNGSDPYELDRLRAGVASAHDVELVEVRTNSGFGPGANAGLRHWLSSAGGSEWAIVAPHDVDPAPDCLATLLDACRSEPMAGLACADVGDGQVPMIDPYFGGLTRPARQTSGWEPADYPHGTLMAIRRECAREVGLFDERYFAYNEEADLGRRARAAGWSVGLVHDAKVRNRHLGTSVATVDYLQHRNTLMMVREMSGRYHALIRFLIAVGHLVSGVARPERRPLVFDPRARALGLLDFLRGRTGSPPPSVTRR